MSDSNFDPFSHSAFVGEDAADCPDMALLLAELKQSQEMNYQMMRLNAWVLSETMDRFLPGFWSRFMANRQIAHKQFLLRQRQGEQSTDAGTEPFSLPPMF